MGSNLHVNLVLAYALPGEGGPLPGLANHLFHVHRESMAVGAPNLSPEPGAAPNLSPEPTGLFNFIRLASGTDLNPPRALPELNQMEQLRCNKRHKHVLRHYVQNTPT